MGLISKTIDKIVDPLPVWAKGIVGLLVAIGFIYGILHVPLTQTAGRLMAAALWLTYTAAFALWCYQVTRSRVTMVFGYLFALVWLKSLMDSPTSASTAPFRRPRASGMANASIHNIIPNTCSPRHPTMWCGGAVTAIYGNNPPLVAGRPSATGTSPPDRGSR